MTINSELPKAEEYLAKHDSVLADLITKLKPIQHKPHKDHFMALSRSIISQQVSVAAARSIFSKYKIGTGVKPDNVDQLEIEELREFGLSRQKARYLKDLAQHFIEDARVFEHLNELDDQTVIEELTEVKGVGEWTAQMFLISTLSRVDVFAPDDVGLQRAIKINYPNVELNKSPDFAEFATRWKPYRSIASLYLWKSLNNNPTD